MSKLEISLTVNGRPTTGEVEPRTHLADFLREDLLLTGTHLGCEQGVCGACTVMINGRPNRSCITLAVACDSADVRTVESFDDDALMAHLRAAFTQHHGLQCGFCTPGFLATAYDIVTRLPEANEERIRKELSGNLCRCTGYQGAVNAVTHVIASSPPLGDLAVQPRTKSQVGGATDAESSVAEQSAQASRATPLIPEKIVDGVQLNRSLTIDAPSSDVWRVLEDVEAVVSCVPGGQVVRQHGRQVEGLLAVAIGPMSAKFDGAAEVEFDATNTSGRVIGRGGDRLSRSNVDGEMTFALQEAGSSQSKLDLKILYQLKGPLAQFGRPIVVAEDADRILADTASNIAARATGRENMASAAKPASGFGLFWSALIGLFKGIFKR